MRRHQVVCKQSDPSNYVYLIERGEFEIQKQAEIVTNLTRLTEQQKQLYRTALGHSYADKNENKIKMLRQQIQKDYSQVINGQIKLAVVGSGLIFGDDDILAKRPYKASLVCSSQSGSVYILKREDFMKVFRTENESWKVQF